MNDQVFDGSALCSRKLWELVSETPTADSLNREQILLAVSELQQRRHFLTELAKLRQPVRIHTE